MERRTNENEETREFDHTDFYQMYHPSLPLPQAYRNKNFLILQGFSCFFYASFV